MLRSLLLSATLLLASYSPVVDTSGIPIFEAIEPLCPSAFPGDIRQCNAYVELPTGRIYKVWNVTGTDRIEIWSRSGRGGFHFLPDLGPQTLVREAALEGTPRYERMRDEFEEQGGF